MSDYDIERAGVNVRRTRPRIDLLVEVRSRPTEEMWEAMRSAEFDMYMLGEGDPNVVELERRMAKLAGKEAAFFVMTGALGELLGLLSLAPRGTQVIMERRSHIYWVEGNSAAFVGGVAINLLDGDKFGRISVDQLRKALRHHQGVPQPTSLVWLENTHGASGGCALSPDETYALAEVAKEHSASVFVDGARLWEAAAYHNASLADMLRGVDGAMVSMTKSLGAPVGTVLVGSADFIAAARRNIFHVGAYSVHRMGFLAAAALVALDTRRDTIPDDLRRARTLAEGLSAIDGLTVDMDLVQTNMVRVEVTHPGIDAPALRDRLEEAGVGSWVLEPGVLRFHTYHEISDQDIAEAIDITRDVMDNI